MIEILQAMALTTVQDLGRVGYRRFGVGTAGAMDPVALQVGNLMLGNAADAAALEINLFPFRARFLHDTAFAVTGADCRPLLDGKPLMPWWAATARAGQELSLHAPASAARAYVCVGGGIDVPRVLGSRSTQLRGAIGGFHGRMLVKNDVVPAACYTGASIDFGVLPPEAELDAPHSERGTLTLRVIPAGEYASFTAASRDAFWRSDWSVTLQSNRTGYRLAGEGLSLRGALEMRSYGVVPGLVQVPPSGQPIIQMADANVSGGYPKIATVIGADLWRLGQAAPRTRLRFVETSAADAVQASSQIRAYLERVKRLAARARLDA
ncbi:MAG: biotin-dependent carboxyltransferase family protein [Janthinobacterium lividum]